MDNQKDNLNGRALLLVIIDWINAHHLVHYGDSYGSKYVMCPFLLLLRWIGNNKTMQSNDNNMLKWGHTSAKSLRYMKC